MYRKFKKVGLGLLGHVTPSIYFSRILRSEVLVYKSYLFFRTAILQKLFDIRFSYKHCNYAFAFLSRWHWKPWQGLGTSTWWPLFIFIIFQEIRTVTRELEQSAREILAVLQAVHQTPNPEGTCTCLSWCFMRQLSYQHKTIRSIYIYQIWQSMRSGCLDIGQVPVKEWQKWLNLTKFANLVRIN